MKTVYISWHYTNHGIATLKHILSDFYQVGQIPENINRKGLDQAALNKVFDAEKRQKKFKFDKIIYLTAPQKAFDSLSTRRNSHKSTILEDELIISEGMREVWNDLLHQPFCYNLEKEIEFVSKKYPDKQNTFIKLLWRNIHHYEIAEQIKWLNEYSNFNRYYSDQFCEEKLAVDNLRNEESIAKKLSAWARKYFSENKDIQPVINISLGSNETQVVWHILAEAGVLPPNTRFIKYYDDKTSDPDKRFKKFSLVEITPNLISTLSESIKPFRETQSPLRKLVNKKMEVLLYSGFSILLMGERGIGKSRLAQEARAQVDNSMPFVEANCASFADDDKAESELFGVAKGVFTGVSEKKGLLLEANGGILFLDEIHHLSKMVQAKLMKAMQTDTNNKMSIRRLGENKEQKVELKMIFATNRTIKELKEDLLPDFYDRIVQHVIEIPPLRDTREDRISDWEGTWRGLKFKVMPEPPKDSELGKWLTKLPLYGNFRDLQKIGMYYNAFLQFDDETREMITEKSAFAYAKAEFEKYHSSSTPQTERFNFNETQTTKEMIADYQFELQDWAVKKFEGRKKAIEHFNDLKDTVTEKTFNDWKNRRSLKE